MEKGSLEVDTDTRVIMRTLIHVCTRAHPLKCVSFSYPLSHQPCSFIAVCSVLWVSFVCLVCTQMDSYAVPLVELVEEAVRKYSVSTNSVINIGCAAGLNSFLLSTTFQKVSLHETSYSECYVCCHSHFPLFSFKYSNMCN